MATTATSPGTLRPEARRHELTQASAASLCTTSAVIAGCARINAWMDLSTDS